MSRLRAYGDGTRSDMGMGPGVMRLGLDRRGESSEGGDSKGAFWGPAEAWHRRSPWCLWGECQLRFLEIVDK